MGKRYYWLKLPDDFFRQKPIKKLRRIAGGDTYTIIYLKMLLVSLKNEGKLFFDGVEENFTEEIALELDEEEENVKVTVQFLMAQGLLQLIDESEYELTECSRMVGSESASAERMRRLRDQVKKKSGGASTAVKYCVVYEWAEDYYHKEEKPEAKKKVNICFNFSSMKSAVKKSEFDCAFLEEAVKIQGVVSC